MMDKMERKISIEGVALGARRRKVALRACPHCGGDVRLTRDLYGAYLQCIQCSRELQPGALAAHQAPSVAPSSTRFEELGVAQLEAA